MLFENLLDELFQSTIHLKMYFIQQLTLKCISFNGLQWKLFYSTIHYKMYFIQQLTFKRNSFYNL